MEEFLGPQAEYNEEEEERKYYRRKRLGVIKNVLAASVGAMIVYSVYMGAFDWRNDIEVDNAHKEAEFLICVCVCVCYRPTANAANPPL